MTPGVVRRERQALVVLRRRPDERLCVRIGQRVYGAVQAEPGECFRFALARAEAGAPKQPLRVGGVERTFEDGYPGHDLCSDPSFSWSPTTGSTGIPQKREGP